MIEFGCLIDQPIPFFLIYEKAPSDILPAPLVVMIFIKFLE